jgi:flagellar basal-body rod protein FlgB
MGLIPTHLLNSPQKMISMVAQRQECLSDNIANMHTKGYRRKDVDFSQYLNTGISSRIEANVIDKYGPSPLASSSAAGGENISTEDELAKMQENYLLYNVAVRHLSSTITEIKTALNVSQSG